MTAAEAPEAILAESVDSHRRRVAEIQAVSALERKARWDLRLLENSALAATDLSDRISSLLYTFRMVTNQPTLVSGAFLAKYLEAIPRAVTNLGSGAHLATHDSVSTAMRDAIARCESDGVNVSDLHLSLARFLSYSTLETKERERAIDAAIAKAETIEARLRATYALAWYLVEVSKYREAIDVCRQAANDAASDEEHSIWQLSFITMEAVARYTTLNAPDEVRALLVDVLPQFAAVTRRSRDIEVAYSEALHYLGRCELDRGDTGSALALFVRSHRIKERHPYESRAIAYYHVRMAEALMGGANLPHAKDHLDIAEKFLERVADQSAGRVNYQIALANLRIEQGERQSAAKLLDEAARTAKREHYARGYLLALGRLFALRLHNHELRAMVVLLRAAPIPFSGELRRNSLVAILANFRRYALAVLRPYGRHGDKINVSRVDDCPCPVHADTVVD